MLRNWLSPRHLCQPVFCALFQQRAQEPKPIRLWLSPAKPPTPALRYQLLPDARVVTAGNAADVYQQVIDLLAKKPRVQEATLTGSVLDVPLNRLPNDEVRKELAPYNDVFALLDKAVCCDYCEWGLRERLLKDGLGTLIPEIQTMRECGLLLAVKARLEMAEGNSDKALATVRTGLAVARHTGQTDTLLAFQVGVAIANLMEVQLDQFIAQRDAPNLYYALTDLPAPLISMQRALESERLGVMGTFPGLGEAATNLDAGNLSEKDLQKAARAMEYYINDCQPLGYAGRLVLAWNIQQKHALAKKALLDAGRPRDKVEAMPHLQVALLHAMLEYDAALDNLLVAQKQPYWEWSGSVLDANKRYLRERWKYYDSAALPLVPTVLPGVTKVMFARARLERKTALLRTIEALRFYAATHDGQLPPSLAAIKEVPLPVDAVTGKALEYRLDGDVAKLRAPPPAGQVPTATNTVVYEMKIRP